MLLEIGIQNVFSSDLEGFALGAHVVINQSADLGLRTLDHKLELFVASTLDSLRMDEAQPTGIRDVGKCLGPGKDGIERLEEVPQIETELRPQLSIVEQRHAAFGIIQVAAARGEE